MISLFVYLYIHLCLLSYLFSEPLGFQIVIGAILLLSILGHYTRVRVGPLYSVWMSSDASAQSAEAPAKRMPNKLWLLLRREAVPLEQIYGALDNDVKRKKIEQMLKSVTAAQGQRTPPTFNKTIRQ